MKITLIISLLAFLAYITIISQKLVTIGAILILRSILTTVFTSFVSNSWYGFILFLIYITGLLVLFGYFLAIRPNIHHSAKNCFKAYTFFFLPIFLSGGLYFTYIPSNKVSFEKDVSFLLFNFSIYLIIVIILLLALLIVVSLTYKAPSPLRNHL